MRETSEEREREREIKRGAVRREGKSLYTESLYIHIYIYTERERAYICRREIDRESLRDSTESHYYIYIYRERESVYRERRLREPLVYSVCRAGAQ